jgi:hypothetical protein
VSVISSVGGSRVRARERERERTKNPREKKRRRLTDATTRTVLKAAKAMVFLYMSAGLCSGRLFV